MDLRGSHIAIKVGDKTLGDGEPKIEYAYSDASERMGVENAMCVYPTLNPRCVAYSKPTAAFKFNKKAICRAEQYESTCFDQCYAIHCSEAEIERKGACGRGKAFQDCANCCGGNNNVASGCFRRRRRLGAAVEALAGPEISYTFNQCAEACLNTFGCLAFKHDVDDACFISSSCDMTKKGFFGYEGGWQVYRTLEKQDLTSAEISNEPEEVVQKKKKKRRRKGKGHKDKDAPMQFGPPPGADPVPIPEGADPTPDPPQLDEDGPSGPGEQ